jgi:sec-independent protein translocase protein TatA
VPDLGKPEILILLVVILVLFGAKRLPGAARSLGQSMRIFKSETKGLRDDAPAEAPTSL